MTAPRAYAGIGSRTTPEDVLALMRRMAHAWGAVGALLRSGGAPGADTAFEQGALDAHGPFELFLPWPGFEGRAGPVVIPDACFALAARYHPGWEHLGRGARAMHARNCQQVLGADLDDPVDFVVCWTPDGDLTGTGSRAGGTGQALRVATGHGVPVRNLARPSDRAWAHGLLGEPVPPRFDGDQGALFD